MVTYRMCPTLSLSAINRARGSSTANSSFIAPSPSSESTVTPLTDRFGISGIVVPRRYDSHACCG